MEHIKTDFQDRLSDILNENFKKKSQYFKILETMKIPPVAIKGRRFQKVSPQESLPGFCEASEGSSIRCEQCPAHCRAQQTHAAWVANLNRNVRTQPM